MEHALWLWKAGVVYSLVNPKNPSQLDFKTRKVGEDGFRLTGSDVSKVLFASAGWSKTVTGYLKSIIAKAATIPLIVDAAQVYVKGKRLPDRKSVV